MGRWLPWLLAVALFSAQIALADEITANPEFLVSADDPHEPSIAIDSNGRVVVIWTDDDGHWDGVFGRRFDSAGYPLGERFLVSSYTLLAQEHPDIAADGSGGFVVVWNGDAQDDRSNFQAYGRRFGSDGSPIGIEFLINRDGPNEHASHPRVAAAADGRFVVAWQGPDVQVFARRYRSDGSPEGDQFRVSLQGYANLRPDIAADPAGNFVVAWNGFYTAEVTAAIFVQRYDGDGQRVGSEFQVDAYIEGYDLYDVSSVVAVDTDGNFLVVWRHVTFVPGDVEAELLGRRYDSAGIPTGAEFRVNAYTPVGVGDPALAVGPGGRFVVAWESYGKPGSAQVVARRASRSGPFVEPEFQVSSSTVAGYPAIAVHADGGIAVAWREWSIGGDEIRARTLSVGCGDGVVNVFEGCDDGNRSDGDCCTSSCRNEPDGLASCDGNACTRSDACLAGTCVPGPCADGAPCTICGGECVKTDLACECSF